MMKLDEFKEIMSLGALRTKNQIKEHLPEIIFGVSTIILTKGIVDICKKMPEWNDCVEDHELNFNDIHLAFDNGEITEKEQVKAEIKEGCELSKDFMLRLGGPITMIGMGIAGYGVSLALAKKQAKDWKEIAALNALSLLGYRGRVADAIGADKEYDIFHNIKRKVVEEEYIDENGKKKKRKKEVIENPEEMMAGDHNSYWYGAGDAHWQGIKEIDLNFIIETERMFNRILVGRGHGAKVTKEEVLRFLKWDKNDPYKLEAVTNGWVYNEHGKYNFYYDPITGEPEDLPRIIKLIGSREFMDKDDDCDETFIDMNCYPIMGILKAQQDDILQERISARGGRYIATVPGVVA